jgi:hypothetical protein
MRRPLTVTHARHTQSGKVGIELRSAARAAAVPWPCAGVFSLRTFRAHRVCVGNDTRAVHRGTFGGSSPGYIPHFSRQTQCDDHTHAAKCRCRRRVPFEQQHDGPPLYPTAWSVVHRNGAEMTSAMTSKLLSNGPAMRALRRPHMSASLRISPHLSASLRISLHLLQGRIAFWLCGSQLCSSPCTQ